MSMIDAKLSAVNPRDSWPDWTDDYRWEPTPDSGYLPTAEEEAEASQLLNDDDDFGTPDVDWDDLAGAAHAEDMLYAGLRCF